MSQQQEVDIPYQQDGAAFNVVLTGKSLNFFASAAQHADLKDIQGEALIAALLQSKGQILKIRRYRDGKLNDGPGGEPAFQRFNDSGTLIGAESCRNDHLVKKLTTAEIEKYVVKNEIEEIAGTINAAFGGRLKINGPA
jgi:hypothetical protein